MRIGISIIIFFLSLIALVAEVVLYFIMGIGAAFSGDANAVPSIAVFFVCLMVFTAAVGVLAPVSAVIGELAKNPQVSYYIMLPSLGVVFFGLLIFGAFANVRGSGARSASHELASGDRAEGENAGGQAQTWQYLEDDERMGQGKIQYATVQSTNTVDFGFPYTGPQRGQLTLRTHPRYGKDVIFSVQRGQILSGIGGTNVQVSFDGAKPHTFWASEPADHSSTSLFIRDYPGFVARLRSAKIARVEVVFYQQGNQVFEFNVAGLQNAALEAENPSNSRQRRQAEAEARSWRTQAYCEQNGFVWKDGGCHPRK